MNKKRLLFLAAFSTLSILTTLAEKSCKEMTQSEEAQMMAGKIGNVSSTNPLGLTFG